MRSVRPAAPSQRRRTLGVGSHPRCSASSRAVIVGLLTGALSVNPVKACPGGFMRPGASASSARSDRMILTACGWPRHDGEPRCVAGEGFPALPRILESSDQTGFVSTWPLANVTCSEQSLSEIADEGAISVTTSPEIEAGYVEPAQT